MSFAGSGNAADANAAPKPYYCYQCERTVSATSSSDEPLCPICLGGFLEEYESHNLEVVHDGTAASANDLDDPFAAALPEPLARLLGGLPFLFSSPDLRNPRNVSTIFPRPQSQQPQTQSQSRSEDPNIFDPVSFLESYIQGLSAGGSEVQFVVENHPSESGTAPWRGGFSLPSNFGDYFVGPGLEQLIQQLAENDPNRYGTPPASKSAVRTLVSDILVTDELLASDFSQCAVCMDEFERGAEVKQMPCRHVYHSDCLLPWLELHNSCPVCRYELPTDDAEYENRVLAQGEGGSGSSGGGAGSQQNSQGPTGGGRRLMISLPWSFGAFNSLDETIEGGIGSRNRNHETSNSMEDVD